MNASYSPIRSFKGLAIVACLGMILLTGGQQSAWALGDDLVKLVGEQPSPGARAGALED